MSVSHPYTTNVPNTQDTTTNQPILTNDSSPGAGDGDVVDCTHINTLAKSLRIVWQILGTDDGEPVGQQTVTNIFRSFGIAGTGILNSGGWVTQSKSQPFTNTATHNGTGDWTIHASNPDPGSYCLCFPYSTAGCAYQASSLAGDAYNIKFVDMAGAPFDGTVLILLVGF
jgi:hypothetical protein